MEQKLIFFDIDGTLIEEGKEYVPESNIEAIRRAQENGHLCFINTGRPITSVGSMITDLGFDGYICGCGTYVSYHGKEIFHKELSQELLKKMVSFSRDHVFDIFFEGKEGLFFPPEFKCRDGKRLREYFTDQGAKVCDYDYDGKVFHADKFTAWYRSKEDAEALFEILKADMDIIERGEGFWEGVPKGFSKASGIDELLRYLQKDLKDTISIGDSFNDVAMLQHTKESVLMGNGKEELKDMVTYVTADVTEDGVCQALEHFGLI